jgi:hypothetical protein
MATDRLDIDPWLPAEGPTSGGPAGAARWFAEGGLGKAVGGETAQVTVRAEHAILRGLPVDGVLLDATARPDGQLTVRALDGAASGFRLNASGAIGGDGQLTDVKLRLTGGSASPLAALTAIGFPWPAVWKGAMNLEIEGGGPLQALALGIALDLGNARLEAQPVLNLTDGSWQAAATLRHPSAAVLLAKLGLLSPPDMTGTESWLGEGSLSLIGQFGWTPGHDGSGRLTADKVNVTAGSLRASGHLVLEGRQINGAVQADVLPVPLPDPASHTPLPLLALQGWHGNLQVQAAQVVAGSLELLDNAAMTVTLTGDALTIDGLSAQLGGGAIGGSASLNIVRSPPVLTAAATLHDAAIHAAADNPPMGLLSGHADASVTLTASGYSPAALLATLSGSLHVTARDGALAGFDLFGAARALDTADGQTPTETEQDLRAALQAGTTSFDRLDVDAEAAHGLLHLTDTQLRGPAGGADAQGDIGLTDGTMDVQVSLTPAVPGSPTVGLRLDGSLSDPAHQPELAAASRWLAERPMTR